MKNIILLGGLMIDHYMYVDHYPLRGGDCIVEKEANYVGGCPFNVANALKQLGFNAMVYSHVYDDSNGKLIQNHLTDNGFNTSLCISGNGETGTCYIVIDNKKERTFFSNQKDEGYFAREDFTDELLKQTKYFYVSGVYLSYKTHNNDIISFMEELHNNEKTIIFDASPLIETLSKEEIQRIIKTCNVIKANKEEYEVIRPYIDLTEQLALVTDGANGADIYSDKYQLHHVSYPCNVCDSNGAGDNFLAGFIYAYDLRFNHTSCLDIASACGALACEQQGTAVNISIDSIQKKISEGR